uniref:Initiator tRNA phosphoribosyl transferase n=1 Tax=Mucochytrium quahogii TaxID=96639 RepID=A0A7S2WAW5_9STRA|mmetsp:Transcript_7328/g.13203  ORF Transcript_7328/g.13203 Transcript_7328/m.13203 type:complete len:532 (+) Transcript_7328:5614-7209(+)|eukprot:CAMPEP_0203756642 /NCGR_PEP_ID=MMETSP0098-20131031/9879_1 /ASSEMBLY_ACC=CAM_ASM_000208 /TAXON_ID=96639 /ORGANISM=" , Strain NY0313808BC1" /LENGTH=531 /DNA_ID=CAMNT_0050648595 /DNA_START=325 /DNA_END=1920 /DNA_ORIENTATION=-
MCEEDAANFSRNDIYLNLASLKKQSLSMHNRLRSIVHDEEFVSYVAGLYHNVPLVANMRCGAWYSEKFKSSVYFKSTDGHAGKWEMSTKRTNLHLCLLLAQNKGCIIVDSTRKGKSIPDSFSKTIPIWCACINRLVKKRLCAQNDTKLLSGWDDDLHVPPWCVSDSERNAIIKQLDGFVEKFESAVSPKLLDSVLPLLKKPLRALWITPSTHMIEGLQPNLTKLRFYPVMCLTASETVNAPGGVVAKRTFQYQQGSADDHESWSMGLSASAFWGNLNHIMSDPALCEQHVLQVVEQTQGYTGYEHIEQHLSYEIESGVNQVEKSQFHRIGTTNLYIGSRSASKPPGCYQNFDAIVNCCTLEYEDNQRSSTNYLWLPIPEGKKGGKVLEKCIPIAMLFIAKCMLDKKRVLVHCAQGVDRSVTIVMAALLLFFSPCDNFSCPRDELEQFAVLPKREDIIRFASCRKKESCCSCMRNEQEAISRIRTLALSLERTKVDISGVLAYIASFRPVASPCKNNIKGITRFLMSEHITC